MRVVSLPGLFLAVLPVVAVLVAGCDPAPIEPEPTDA